MSDKIREQIQAIAAKIETQPGVYEAPDSANDVIFAANITLSYSPQTDDPQEYTGTLDTANGESVTGYQATVNCQVILVGEPPHPATEPRFARLLRACGLTRILTAVDIAGSAQGGDATSIQLAASDVAGDGDYVGQAIDVAGELSTITAYDATTKIASLSTTLTTPAAAGTAYTILAQETYAPVSQGVPSVSLDLFKDGVKKRMMGVRGSVEFTLTTAQKAMAVFTLQGMVTDPEDAPVPVVDYQRLRFGQQTGGAAFFNNIPYASDGLSVNLNNTMAFPSDAAAENGFGAPEITGRAISASISPDQTLAAVRNPFVLSRSNQLVPIVQMGSGVAGARIAATIPSGLLKISGEGNRSGIATDTIEINCKGADSGAYISIF